MSGLSSFGDKVTPQMQKIMSEQQAHFDELDNTQRFGFFSIPPNQTIGDRFYSLNKEFHHKIIDRKVVSEKRGIFASGPKSGKGHDAYFQSMDTTDQGCQERLAKGWQDDYKKHLIKVQEFKHRPVTAVFKYPGVQHYKDEFDNLKKNEDEHLLPFFTIIIEEAPFSLMTEDIIYKINTVAY